MVDQELDLMALQLLVEVEVVQVPQEQQRHCPHQLREVVVVVLRCQLLVHQ
jgi:hypothetical protein